MKSEAERRYSFSRVFDKVDRSFIPVLRRKVITNARRRDLAAASFQTGLAISAIKDLHGMADCHKRAPPTKRARVAVESSNAPASFGASAVADSVVGESAAEACAKARHKFRQQHTLVNEHSAPSPSAAGFPHLLVGVESSKQSINATVFDDLQHRKVLRNENIAVSLTAAGTSWAEDIEEGAEIGESAEAATSELSSRVEVDSGIDNARVAQAERQEGDFEAMGTMSHVHNQSPAWNCPARIIRCEAVLRARSGRILIVLDRICDAHNVAAALRTAEALGVQHVWSVGPTLGYRKRGRRHDLRRPVDIASVAKGSDAWLSLRFFETPAECIAALSSDGWTVWVTGDGENSLSLARADRPKDINADEKIAVVIGRETDGVCEDFANASSRRVFLPLSGFTTSLNLSVATGLILQRLFDWFPHFRGDLSHAEKAAVRACWRDQIANNKTARCRLGRWIDHPEHVPQTFTNAATARITSSSWAPKDMRCRDSATQRAALESGRKI